LLHNSRVITGGVRNRTVDEPSPTSNIAAVKCLSASQELLKSKISATRAGQSEFEERITDMLGKQLKGIMAVVNHQT
jgi:hypothetical protein